MRQPGGAGARCYGVASADGVALGEGSGVVGASARRRVGDGSVPVVVAPLVAPPVLPASPVLPPVVPVAVSDGVPAPGEASALGAAPSLLSTDGLGSRRRRPRPWRAGVSGPCSFSMTARICCSYDVSRSRDLGERHLGDVRAEVGDLLPQRRDLLPAGVAERAVEGDEELRGEGVGQAVDAVVVDRGRDVLRHGDVVVAGDQDDLEADRDRRAVGAARERVGLVGVQRGGVVLDPDQRERHVVAGWCCRWC